MYLVLRMRNLSFIFRTDTTPAADHDDDDGDDVDVDDDVLFILRDL